MNYKDVPIADDILCVLFKVKFDLPHFYRYLNDTLRAMHAFPIKGYT